MRQVYHKCRSLIAVHADHTWYSSVYRVATCVGRGMRNPRRWAVSGGRSVLGYIPHDDTLSQHDYVGPYAGTYSRSYSGARTYREIGTYSPRWG